MLNILGMILLIIILFIIILLIIGIKVSFEYTKKDNEFKGCLKILIFKKIKIYSHNFPSHDDDDDESEDTEKKQHNIKKIIKLAKPCFKDLLNYLKSIINLISVKKIENHIIFGMNSYADTGKYIGMIWAILAIVNRMNDNIKLSAEPSFSGTVFDAYGVNEFEIYPIKILVPTIKLISKKHIRKLIRGVLDER